MKRWQCRIVCMMLVLVIVVSAALQPKVKAIALVDDALLLLVGALIIGTGFVLASDNQAKSMASHALQSMPGSMKSSLQDMSASAVLSPGAVNTAGWSVNAWGEFRSFIKDLFKVTDGAIESESIDLREIGLLDQVISLYSAEHGYVTLPVYDYYKIESYRQTVDDDFRMKISIPWVDFSYNGTHYTVIPKPQSGNPLRHEVLKNGSYGTAVNSIDGNIRIFFDCHENGILLRIVTKNANNVLGYGTGLMVSSQANVMSPNIAVLSPPAYTHIYDQEKDIAITYPGTMEDLVGKTWTDIVDSAEAGTTNPDINTESWEDIKERIGTMVQEIPELIRDASGTAGVVASLEHWLEYLKWLQETLNTNPEVLTGQKGAVLEVLEGIEALMEQARSIAETETGTEVAELVKSIAITNEKLQTLTDTLTDVLTLEGNLTMDGAKNWPSLSTLFPFCIPFDIAALIGNLRATPEAPVFTATFPAGIFPGGGEVALDMSKFDAIAAIVRWIVLIAFVYGLMVLTSRVIKW